MKEWSAKVGGQHWRLAIKNRRLYGKLVGDTTRELLPLGDAEVRKKPEAEQLVEILIGGDAPVIAEAKTRMVKASCAQMSSSLNSRLRHLKVAKDFLKQGYGKHVIEDDLARSMALCMEIIEAINEIPTE